MAKSDKPATIQQWLDRLNPKMDPRDGKTLAEKLDAVWSALAEADAGAGEEFMSLLEFMANHAQSAGMWTAIGEWCRRHDWRS